MSRGAAFGAVTLIAALGVSMPALTAQASSAGWQQVYRSTAVTGNELQSVAAVSPGDAWAAGSWGDGALVMHWNGSKWSRVTVPGQSGFSLTEVRASSAANVWLFGADNNGENGTILRWNGSSWQDVPLPAGVIPNAAAVLSVSDVWISGPETCTGSGSNEPCQTALYHWNGSAWDAPDYVPTQVNAMSGSGARNVWLVGESRVSTVTENYTLAAYRWNGSAWVAPSMPEPRSGGAPDVTAQSSANVWLFAWQAKKSSRGFVLHWNGTRWSEDVAPGRMAASDGLATDGSGGVWAGALAHWTGSRWLNTSPGVSFVGTDAVNLHGLARVPGQTRIWAVGAVSHTASSSTWDSLIAQYP